MKNQPMSVTAVTLPNALDIADIAPPVPKEFDDMLPMIKLKFALWKSPIPDPTIIILKPISTNEDSGDNMLYDNRPKLTIHSPTTLVIPGPYLSEKYPPIGEHNDIEIAFSNRNIPKIIDDAEIISATKKGSINKLTKDPIYKNRFAKKPPKTIGLLIDVNSIKGLFSEICLLINNIIETIDITKVERVGI
tara:strand:+ start:1191 stop:1763 length:573 start_codon:yes stop_codon:yes gene_type:complete